MSSEVPSRRVCAVCARVLNTVSLDAGGVGYIHTQPVDDDHPVVPVLPREVEIEGRCDFCNGEMPQWFLPVRTFDTGISISLDDWSCCDTCASLLEKDRWTALLRRVKTIWEYREAKKMPAEMEAGVSRLYRKVRKNVTGSIKPITDLPDLQS